MPASMIDKKSTQKSLAKLIGANIATQRKQAGWTQGELAEKVGVDTETISRFERGATIPSLVTLQLLSVALNTTMASLLGESSPMPNDQAQVIAGWLSKMSETNRGFLMDMVKRWCAHLR